MDPSHPTQKSQEELFLLRMCVVSVTPGCGASWMGDVALLRVADGGA
jgi:hypothetical protein